MARAFGAVDVNVDGDNMASVANESGDKGSIISAAGAYLKDVVTIVKGELFEHESHNGWLRGRDQELLLDGLDRDRSVLVCLGQARAGNEDVTGYLTEGGLDPTLLNIAASDKFIDQAIP